MQPSQHSRSYSYDEQDTHDDRRNHPPSQYNVNYPLQSQPGHRSSYDQGSAPYYGVAGQSPSTPRLYLIHHYQADRNLH